MELSAEIDRAVEEMEWGELVSTLQEVIHEILGDTPNPPSPPPPPIPAGLELDTHPQPAESQGEGYGGYIPLGAAPHMFEQQSPLMAAPSPTTYYGPLQEDIMQPGHLYTQAGASSQGQYNDVPMVRLPEGSEQNLRCIGVLNGQVLYEVPADFAPLVSAAPPLNASNSKKRKRDSQQEDGRPYVKKPPNAFMLFMKEQRPNVEAEFNIRGSAAVNTVLGQRWKSLSKEEQAKYYDQADKERQLHAQRHPEWSSSDNYGKKRKRHRSKAPTRAEASASKPEEETQQAKKLCVRPVQTAVLVMEPVMEPSSSQTDVMEAPHLQTVWVQLPHTETVVTVPVCHNCHLPQVYEVSPASWLDAPVTASASLASPAAPTQTESSQSEDVGGQVSSNDGAA